MIVSYLTIGRGEGDNCPLKYLTKGAIVSFDIIDF